MLHNLETKKGQFIDTDGTEYDFIEYKWKDGIPDEFMLMTSFSWFEVETSLSPKLRKWVKLSLNLLVFIAKEIIQSGLSQLQKKEITEAEYNQILAYSKNIPPIEATKLLVDYLRDEDHQRLLIDNQVESNETSGNDEYSPIVVRILAARAIFLLDQAITYWQEGRLQDFLQILAAAIDANMRSSDESTDAFIEEFTLKHDKTIEEIQKEGRKKTAQSGGNARSDKYQPLRDKTKEMAATMKIKSIRDAARNLAPKINEWALQNDYPPLSETQKEITIARWLKEAGLQANISR